ncbi:Flp pilus assembly protein TadB [Minicystis rosea]|nr:Flp pilus assembly protein TadB [Minicystis rosea]
MSLEENLARIRLFKYGGLSLLFVGLFAALVIIIGDAEGMPRRMWARYVVFLERKLRLMFIWTPGNQIAGGQAAGILVLLALGIIIDLPFWWAFALLVAVGPAVYIERLLRQRMEQIEAQLDGFLMALANALKATPSLGDAFSSVQRLIPPPLQQEVELAVKEMRVGSTLDQAMLFMAGRIGSRQVDSALSALLIGRQIGGNLPKILDTTASSLREMARLEGVVRTKTAEGKAQLWVLALFPMVLMVAFNAVKEGYFDPLTQSVTGYAVIVVALLFWIASLVTARKILDVDI